MFVLSAAMVARKSSSSWSEIVFLTPVAGGRSSVVELPRNTASRSPAPTEGIRYSKAGLPVSRDQEELAEEAAANHHCRPSSQKTLKKPLSASKVVFAEQFRCQKLMTEFRR